MESFVSLNLTNNIQKRRCDKNRVTPPYSDRLIVSVTTSRKKIMFILFQSQKILPLHNLHHHRLRL